MSLERLPGVARTRTISIDQADVNETSEKSPVVQHQIFGKQFIDYETTEEGSVANKIALQEVANKPVKKKKAAVKATPRDEPSYLKMTRSRQRASVSPFNAQQRSTDTAKVAKKTLHKRSKSPYAVAQQLTKVEKEKQQNSNSKKHDAFLKHREQR